MISEHLDAAGIMHVSVHGTSNNMIDQMLSFRNGSKRLLISSDIHHRGLDIPSLKVVVNFDIPVSAQNKANSKMYLHRVGRAGRFGKTILLIFLFGIRLFATILFFYPRPSGSGSEFDDGDRLRPDG